jgi:EmrB/QacA subfamily drug resistance transporter
MAATPMAATPMAATHRPWRALALLVAGAFFMENLDGTIIATAAPRMADSFGVRSADLNTAIAAYLLTLGVLIPVSGWAADRFGGRRIFACALAVFTIASALCALSGSLGELTAMRVFQGVGGAMMVPVGRLLVLRVVDREDLVAAIAYLTWPALMAPLLAPPIGGVLATYASWRWIFVLNIPLGILALALTPRIVPRLPNTKTTGLDWVGFLLSGFGLIGLLYALEATVGANVAWVTVAVTAVAGAVLIVLAVRHLWRARDPLVNLRVLRITTFRITSVSGSYFRATVTAIPFLLPLMFQDSFGWTAAKAGLMVIAVFAGNVAVKPATTMMIRRIGFRVMLTTTAVGLAATAALCGLLSAHTPMWAIVAVLFASGVFRSIGLTAYNTLAFADVSQAELSDANGLFAMLHQLTAGLGVAVAATLLRVGHGLEDAISLPGGHDAYTVAFLVIAVLPLLAAIEAGSLDRDAGARITDRLGKKTKKPEQEPATPRRSPA